MDPAKGWASYNYIRMKKKHTSSLETGVLCWPKVFCYLKESSINSIRKGIAYDLIALPLKALVKKQSTSWPIIIIIWCQSCFFFF